MVVVLIVVIAFLAGAALASVLHSGLRTDYRAAQQKLTRLREDLGEEMHAIPGEIRTELLKILGN